MIRSAHLTSAFALSLLAAPAIAQQSGDAGPGNGAEQQIALRATPGLSMFVLDVTEEEFDNAPEASTTCAA